MLRRLWNVALCEMRAHVRDWRFWLLSLIYLGGVGAYIFAASRQLVTAGQVFVGSHMYAALPVPTAGIAVAVLAVLTGATAIERDKASGAFEVLATKPVGAGEYACGKWLGALAVLLPLGVLPSVSGVGIQLALGILPVDPRPYLLWTACASVVPLLLGLSVGLLCGTLGRGLVVGTALCVLLGVAAGWVTSQVAFVTGVDLASLLHVTVLESPFRRGLSDLLLLPFDLRSFFERLAIYGAAVLLCVAATALYVKPMQLDRRPRPIREDAKLRTLLRLWLHARDNLLPDRAVSWRVRASVALAGLALLVGLGAYWRDESDRQLGAFSVAESVRQAHRRHAGRPLAAVLRYEIEVALEPLRHRMDARATIELVNDGAEPLERLLLRLAPVFSVDELTDGAGATLAFERHGDALELLGAAPLAPGARATVTVRYGGRDPEHVFPGFVNYAASDAWYPAIVPWGRDARDAPALHDFFEAAVVVDVPQALQPLTQGRPQPLAAAPGRRRVRFDTGDDRVPALSLIAGGYRSHASSVGGLPVSWNQHPRYAEGFESLETGLEVVLGDQASPARVGYPWGALTVVEMPASLLPRFSRAPLHPGLLLVPDWHYRWRPRRPGETLPWNFAGSGLMLLGWSYSPASLAAAPVLGRIAPTGPGLELLSDSLPRFLWSTQRRAMQVRRDPNGEATIARFGVGNLVKVVLTRPAIGAPADAFYREWVERVGPRLWRSLETALGPERFWPALREFLEEYRYRRPTLADLERSFARSTGEELRWFFEDYVEGREIPEYAIRAAIAERDGERYRLEVTVENLGGGRMRVPLRTVTHGGERRESLWIGAGETVRRTLYMGYEPTAVELDPEQAVFRISGAVEAAVVRREAN